MRASVAFICLGLIFAFCWPVMAQEGPWGQRPRARELGLELGILPPGEFNAITDVRGVKVGFITILEEGHFNTGITAILPHGGNLFLEKVPAAIAVGNGFGKLAGSTQVNELGEIETPILLTGTLSVPRAADGLISYMLSLPGMENVRSINPVVGETNDGFLSDIRSRPITEANVRDAILGATTEPTYYGSIGAGAGTRCFGFKGGIGTASRKLPDEMGGWTVGVLVQTNFGGILTIQGKEIGPMIDEQLRRRIEAMHDGSIMIVLATDAPLSHRNLKRIARRTFLGMARTGGYASNGSGDYAIAFSTHPDLRIRRGEDPDITQRPQLDNDAMSPLFLAAVEATEEAIIDSLFTARTTVGHMGTVEELPVEKILEILSIETVKKEGNEPPSNK